jgi:TonB family protein
MPRYLAAALATHSQGTVRVRLTIQSDGQVENARTVMGSKILGGNSVFFLKQWVFEPCFAKKNRQITVRVHYQLIPRTEVSEKIGVHLGRAFALDVIDYLPEE